jgi:hypothetical protein
VFDLVFVINFPRCKAVYDRCFIWHMDRIVQMRIIRTVLRVTRLGRVGSSQHTSLESPGRWQPHQHTGVAIKMGTQAGVLRRKYHHK